MDLVMPEMDGVEATRLIMEQSPCAILIVTAQPQDNVSQVFRAMGAGALDVTATPLLGFGAGGGERRQRSCWRKSRPSASCYAPVSAAPKMRAAAGGEWRERRATCRCKPFAGDRRLHRRPTGAVAKSAGAAGPRRRATAIVVVQHIDANFAGHVRANGWAIS